MAPRKNARESAASAATAAQSNTPAASSVQTATVSKPLSRTGGTSCNQVLQNIVDYYLRETPQRIKLVDVFLFFLVLVGALQFLYCVLAGNYPFNAFLSGFCATVGQFVLTISLRVQTSQTSTKDFPAVSPERAFADYVVCSLILHFFCINFIN
ncbi:hypothetical protein CDD82_4475 [Ophiocordyceps australis]|uniref:Dolichyl-diphosphooligosaccharide--protein glycosyltransferase subunit OST2 n=1 Tax=Ophiocordyceps australis TaxID=1399860 RepID=A0A2C5Z7K6_9HYPO|nr:hypothetical protein CDD82_4475 [Ophiocordyceps australis]